jgi:hypothetical protein
VPGSAKQLPRNRDFGHVEVVIGQGDENARHALEDTRTEIYGETHDPT